MDGVAEFTLAEMVEMEAIYREIGEETLNPEFCRGLASSFSFTPSRAGKPPVTWRQVQSWFQDKTKSSPPPKAASSMALKLFVDLSDANISSVITDNSQKSIDSLCKHRRKPSDMTELIFEARSAKDYAWYDVATFLSYRVLSTGELEVRVRYAGFRNTDDEWVNVKTAVRERSIPLEPSECHKVKVGDLILCFRDREEHAVYYDSHVVEIQRRLHDMKGCRCLFTIQYDIDGTEESVHLERLCRRPAE